MTLAARLRSALHDPHDPWYWRVDITVYVLIGLSIVLMLAEFWLGETHPVTTGILLPLDYGLMLFFVVEVGARIATFRPPALDFYKLSRTQRLRTKFVGRLKFCFRPYVLFDILTVLALVPELRSLRALRLLRLLRGARIFRYSNPFSGFARAFSDNRMLFAFAFTAVGGAVLIGGLSIYLIEPRISSIGDGIWWAIVTLTTVGYGDISPVTGLGRVIAACMMITGMFTLALFAGIVGHTMLNVVLTIREEQFLMSGYIDHIVVCGYDPGASMLIEALLAEFEEQEQTVLLFGPGERPRELPSEFVWVSGDPTKESELPKAQLGAANCVILIGARGALPQVADATTILTAFTMRRYLGRSHHERTRKKPLYIVAEILDHENVEHAEKAGCDEVIETTRVGFSMLTHAVRVPGAADIISRVALTSNQSLFMGHSRATGTFGEVAHAVKKRTGALLLGFRDPTTGDDVMNPPDATPVPEGALVIYLATSAVLEP